MTEERGEGVRKTQQQAVGETTRGFPNCHEHFACTAKVSDSLRERAESQWLHRAASETQSWELSKMQRQNIIDPCFSATFIVLAMSCRCFRIRQTLVKGPVCVRVSVGVGFLLTPADPCSFLHVNNKHRHWSHIQDWCLLSVCLSRCRVYETRV